MPSEVSVTGAGMQRVSARHMMWCTSHLFNPYHPALPTLKEPLSWT